MNPEAIAELSRKVAALMQQSRELGDGLDALTARVVSIETVIEAAIAEDAAEAGATDDGDGPAAEGVPHAG